jgi:hypothetical protein
MRLEQLYTNVLDISSDELLILVEQNALRRASILSEKSKIDTTSSRVSISLSPQEKSILKALGLSLKDIKTLKEAAGKEDNSGN